MEAELMTIYEEYHWFAEEASSDHYFRYACAFLCLYVCLCEFSDTIVYWSFSGICCVVRDKNCFEIVYL